jgi:lipopolysaccharide export system permease protein
MTFFIAVFILLMQFLWRYIDDLVGKGLDSFVILKLLIFASASLVPLALPLAILLSSIMTFGNMAEHYELAACKSAGVSLQKVMMPLIMFAFALGIGAFFFSNYILPKANLKMGSLLYDVRQQQPGVSIQEGVFYNGIKDYSIKINKKDPDGIIIKDIMIYSHSPSLGSNKLTTAESGKMVMSDDERYLLITLYNGFDYEEQENRKKGNIDTHPLIRSSFKENALRFDLSAFKLNRTNEDLFKNSYQMLNVIQLQKSEDTLIMDYVRRENEFARNLQPYYAFLRDSYRRVHKPVNIKFTKKDFILNFDRADRAKILEAAANNARNVKSYTTSTLDDLSIKKDNIAHNRIEWHLKFTLSFACLVLFFIGAPLGAIIRKGGLGMPMVVSTCFFLLFHVLSITGRKFVQQGVLEAWQGMWLASAILLPIGVFNIQSHHRFSTF